MGYSLNLDRLGLSPFHVWEAANVVALEEPVQRRPAEMRDRDLESIEAVVERQQRMPTESHAHRLLLVAENGGADLLRPHPRVLDRGALAPLPDHLLVQRIPLR